MKRIHVISIIILLPILSFGKIGWWFQNYSILCGPSLYQGASVYHSFDFQYDSQRRTCLSRTAYKGLALSSAFGQQFQEFGVRGFINPTRISFVISPKIRVFPYLFVQQNMVRENQEIKKSDLNTRPGIGVNGVIGLGNLLTTRIQIQGGYSCNRQYLNNGNGLVVELKVGIGIDPKGMKSKEKN